MINRRRFIRSGLASAGLATLPTVLRAAPSERINLGVIGLGARGLQVLPDFLGQADVQVTAVCDVDKLHYRDRKWGKGQAQGREPGRDMVEKHYAAATKAGTYSGCRMFSDSRELCALPDLDAVLIFTPDHWHALGCLAALRAGKDVYCEKPITHTFAEGKRIVAEVAKRKAVFQVGSQQRSSEEFRWACELVRNGHLGKITKVEVGLPKGYSEPLQDAKITEPPAGLDYDAWTGPAPMLDYMRARNHRLWRGHSAYGGGNIIDFIGHHNDIAHWGLGFDESGPLSVETPIWELPESKVYDMPVQYEIRCEYPGDIEWIISSKLDGGITWTGADGWVYVNRGAMQASNSEWRTRAFDRGPIKLRSSTNHVRDFLDCMRSRKPCIAPAATGHCSVTPGHLAFVSQALGRKLNWDSVAQQVLDDNEANARLNKLNYRAPWSLDG